MSVGPVLDLEYRFKRQYGMKRDTALSFRKLSVGHHKSLLLGMHYTNHNHSESGYTPESDRVLSSWNNQYIHLPLIYKFNAQLFPLDEDFFIGFGMGITNSFLLKSQLTESVEIYTRGSMNEIIGSETISDQANVKPFANRHLMMFTFEMSASFKRLYLSIRAWFSLKDQYLKDLETNWLLNDQQSIYLGSYQTWDKVTYGGGAFVLAYKIN